MEQRDLSIGRALPIELLGIEAGCGAGRRRSEEFADRGGEPDRGVIGQNASRLGRADDIGDAIYRGDHHRGAAGHALQQDIGPAFMRRYEQQEVGRAVYFGKAILRHPAEQVYTLGDFALARQLFDAGALGPLADDREFDLRQVGECLDHQPMPLQRDQVAHREKGRPREAEGSPYRLTALGAEQRQIHSVAQNANPVGADAEFDQPAFQPARHRNQTIRVPRCPADPSTRHCVLCDDVEIAASGGDTDRAMEGASEQNGGDAVWIKIVGIDQIEIMAIADLSAQKRQDCGAKGERRRAHSDPGKYRAAWMLDMQAVTGLLARQSRKHGISSESRRAEREPRAGRDNPGADNAARNEFPQTRLDENPVLGLQQVWI